MPKINQGNLIGAGKRFAIVASRFNEFITKQLIDGAIDTLIRHGVKDQDIELTWVPGSFEIPLVAQKIARGKKVDAIIAIGTIIRGETPHFDYVAGEAAKGIEQVSLSSGVPIAFGIITADTTEQAMDRAGLKQGNKGRDAAMSALEMANLL